MQPLYQLIFEVFELTGIFKWLPRTLVSLDPRNISLLKSVATTSCYSRRCCLCPSISCPAFSVNLRRQRTIRSRPNFSLVSRPRCRDRTTSARVCMLGHVRGKLAKRELVREWTIGMDIEVTLEWRWSTADWLQWCERPARASGSSNRCPSVLPVHVLPAPSLAGYVTAMTAATTHSLASSSLTLAMGGEGAVADSEF